MAEVFEGGMLERGGPSGYGEMSFPGTEFAYLDAVPDLVLAFDVVTPARIKIQSERVRPESGGGPQCIPADCKEENG